VELRLRKFIALKDVISSRDKAKCIVALDIEWKIDYSGGAGNSPIHLIQLGYERSHNVNPGADGGSVACLILQLRNKPTMLPNALVNILKDELITFTGRSIQGDITRLKKQFKNLENVAVRFECLHKMAQCRGVIPRGGTSGLADYSKELLGRTMEKDLQTSDWSISNLSSQQQLYAAKDVVYALRINDRLQSLPDLSLPLDENDAVAGIKIDITPHRGSKSAVSALAARGEIVDAAPESVNLPLGFKVSRQSRGDPYYCVVQIDEVVAGSLKVQTVKNRNKQATLREFGSTPFHIILPGTMLRLKRGNRRELADATTYDSMPVQTRASSSTGRRNLNSSNQNGSGPDLPTVEEVFGTEREELLSTSENELLEPDQLAALEANEPLMADEIAAIEGCTVLPVQGADQEEVKKGMPVSS
jgi:hypothetical protein